MKKIIAFLLLVISILSINVLAKTNDIIVKVGGEVLETDTPATIIEGRTMLPVRALFERIGADVEYDSATKTVTAKNDEKTISLVIGSDIMKINGEERKLDVPAMIVNSRTMIPLRACAEAFDLEVVWDKATRTASVLVEDYYLIKEYSNGELIHEYDEKGNLIYDAFDDKSSSYYRYKYDEHNNLVYQESIYGTTEIKYNYDEFGNKKSEEISYSYGGWAKIEYDSQGREIKQDSDAEWFNKTYDAAGNLIFEEKGYHGDEKYTHWNRNTYDERNNLIKVEKSNGNIINYTYDELNRLLSVEYSENDSYNERYTYDYYGNIIRKEKKYYWEENTYDAQGRRIGWKDSKDNVAIWEYDKNGNLIYEKDKDGTEKNYDYDENGNCIFIQSVGKYSSYWIKSTYDEDGNQIRSENDDGKVTIYEYDSNGNKIYSEDTDGNWYKYVYDTHGKLVFWENSYGFEFRYEYILTKR